MTDIARQPARVHPGPSALWRRASVSLDATCPADRQELLIGMWKEQAWRLLAAVRWHDEDVTARRFVSGARLAMSGPLDVLPMAQELLEQAFDAAVLKLSGGAARDLTFVTEDFRSRLELCRQPCLLQLETAAARHGLSFQVSEERALIGLGAKSLCCSRSELPAPENVAWSTHSNAPLVYVSGGELAGPTAHRLVTLAGHLRRQCAWWIEESMGLGAERPRGDAMSLWSHSRADLFVVQAGGLRSWQEGLPPVRARAAIVTDLGGRPEGELGLDGPAEWAEALLLVKDTLAPDGVLILNAEDPELQARAPGEVPKLWYSRQRANPLVLRAVRNRLDAAWWDGAELFLARRGVVDSLTELLDPGARAALEGQRAAEWLPVLAAARALGHSVSDLARALKSCLAPAP